MPRTLAQVAVGVNRIGMEASLSPSGTGAPDPGLDKFKREVAEHYGSDTGAAEPVSDERALELAHQICTGKLSAIQGAVEIMQYATDAIVAERAFESARLEESATPPVRGDREAIARAVDPDAFKPSDKEIAPNGTGSELYHRVVVYRREQALGAADRILSLPVQSGAGERKWPQPFMTAPRDGTPILARCNDHSEMYALRWDGEYWSCRDAKTTFGDGLFLPNGDWCLDPFSRQPPQSSREG